MCPVYVLFTSVAALAETANVAGVGGVTVKLPLVIWAASQLGLSDATLEIVTLLVLVVKLTFCEVADCPENALNVRVEGVAISVPLPPPVPGAYVTVIVTGMLPVALNVTFAVQGEVPQFVLASWKDKMSGVLKLFALNVLSQKGTPERV
jgi:hypothetical protein